MRDHRTLRAIQLADQMVEQVYIVTKDFPREELFGLTSQIRRAAISVAANIVEGCGREGENAYRHFLSQAFGSLREVGYFLELSRRLGYLPQERFDELNSYYDEAAKVLSGLIRSLK
jgi:four helix bundle protein